MPACLPVCFCLCTLRSEEGITSPGAGVTYSCEQPDVHTETRTALPWPWSHLSPRRWLFSIVCCPEHWAVEGHFWPMGSTFPKTITFRIISRRFRISPEQENKIILLKTKQNAETRISGYTLKLVCVWMVMSLMKWLIAFKQLIYFQY